MTTFRWIIYPSRSPELYALADEFSVEGCRLRVGGNTIDVEADDEAKARDLASRYLALLQKRVPILGRVISEEEFTAYPAEIIHITGPTREERERVRRATQAVRNEMLAAGDPALRRCYDYLQAARSSPHATEQASPMRDLYKVIETIDSALGGGEANAIKVLGTDVGAALKAVKRAANEPVRDERHAPDDPTQPTMPTDHGRAWEDTMTVVRAYEEYLRSRR